MTPFTPMLSEAQAALTLSIWKAGADPCEAILIAKPTARVAHADLGGRQRAQAFLPAVAVRPD